MRDARFGNIGRCDTNGDYLPVWRPHSQMKTCFNHRLLITSLSFGLIFLGACGRKSAVHPVVDACTLLTGEEIQSIEGSPLKETKGSGNLNAGLRVSQCFYSTGEFTKSVSVAVTQPDNASPNPRSPKSYWHETFDRFESKAEEKEGDEEKRESLKKDAAEHGEEEESAPPRKVEGLGDAAYWTSNRVGGALYVLHNDAFVRISIGGPDPQEKKIEKCKELAEKALSRM